MDTDIKNAKKCLEEAMNHLIKAMNNEVYPKYIRDEIDKIGYRVSNASIGLTVVSARLGRETEHGRDE